MTPKELQSFMKKHDLDESDLAELLGLTTMAVRHWIVGRRSIAKPYGRILRLFDRHPQLMSEFGK